MRRSSIFWISVLAVFVILLSGGVALALQANIGGTLVALAPGPSDPAEQRQGDTSGALTIEERIAKVQAAREKNVTSEERQAAAARMQELIDVAGPQYAPPVVGPLDQPDYFQSANWAFTPALPKFVDSIAMLGTAQSNVPNSLGKYLSVAVPDTITYPGSDYYELSVRQFTQKVHTNLAATTFRGYVQTNNGTNPATGLNTLAPAPIMYLGPVIVAQKDRPVRIKFTNELPVNAAGDLFIPVDRTIMGSGKGPLGDAAPDYSDNRAVIHLHGGHNGWISDGTPHQWITPAGENTPYPRGVSTQNVPDMPDPGEGSVTMYFNNDQSSRLLFYHDHSWGTTRLNVYVGEAAGYLVRDSVEDQLIADGIIPSGVEEIPLVIQDKSFVQADIIRQTDPTWNWGTGAVDGQGIRAPKTGDLWYPHVYQSAQNPYDPAGVNPFGRWHYGPWFWPPTTDTIQPVNNAYYDPNNPALQPPEIPGTPHPSAPGESFFDTAVVNGVAFPYMEVDPKAYRLRILNAANDRFFNLQMYVASSIMDTITVNAAGTGYTQATTTVQITGGGGTGATADPVVDDATGGVVGIDILTVGSGFTSAPTVNIISAVNPATGQPYGTGAVATATIYTDPTEVGMVPASTGIGLPANWPTDGRVAGVPDPTTKGPDWVQIGTEAGFLAKPAVIETQPITWNNNPTTFNFGNVDQHSLLVAPAERADVIVDFSQYAGQTLIVYNDAPAAFPALDARYDYYTGSPDLTGEGGYWGTMAGMGPNTRTIMQIRVADVTPQSYDFVALDDAFTTTGTQDGVFKRSQDEIVVGQSAYNSVYNTIFPTTYPLWGAARIQDWSLQFRTVNGTNMTLPFQPKALQDEMGEAYDEYGRMSGKLGLQLPNVGAGQQQFVLQNFVDPPTELVNVSMEAVGPQQDDGTQLWRITHNGVDTHPIHFHLFDVQLINRVGWDGAIRWPDDNELGWKDTIRVSPLEDTFVALRATATKIPFGLPESVRPLNPAQPLGSPMGFSNFDPYTGNPLATPTLNAMYNFGWEYVWHCHILSHEEMDMMRTIKFVVPTQVPAAPVLAAVTGAGDISLYWTDGTPVAAPDTPGNPANEIGYRIERAPVTLNGQVGDFAEIARAQANQITFVDSTATGVNYRYRVIAYNASGEAMSNVATPGAAPAMVITVTSPNGGESWANGSNQNLTWTLNAPVSTGEFGVWLVDGVGNWVQAAFPVAPVAGSTSYSVPWTVNAVPRADYKLAVYYRTDTGAWMWPVWDYSDANLAVTGSGGMPTITVTAPNGGQTLTNGNVENLTWTINAPVSAGEFGAWLVDGVGNWREAVFPVAPTAGTSYTVPWVVNVPARTDYKLAVYYRVDTGAWLWPAWDYSDTDFAVAGDSIPTITVTSPNGAESWVNGSNHNITFTLSGAVTTGQFGAWLVDSVGNWVQAAFPINPVAGSTSYSVPWTVSAPARNDYKMAVYFRTNTGVWLWPAWDYSDANLAVTGG